MRNVQSLMLGASYLSLPAIVGACGKYLQQHLAAANALSIRAFAVALNSGTLARAADRFIQKHFVHVVRTPDFLALGIDDLVAILDRDELHVHSEEQVFECAMHWLEHQDDRQQYCSRVLGCVRLPLLKPAYLTDRVAADDRIRNCLRCRDLVDEARDYHLMPERRALMHTARTKPRCCSDVQGIIYAVGGLTNAGDTMSTVEMYDPLICKWTVVEPMSTLRCDWTLHFE